MSPCRVCSAPIVTDPENGEVFCASDPGHDLSGSELVDDEFPNEAA